MMANEEDEEQVGEIEWPVELRPIFGLAGQVHGSNKTSHDDFDANNYNWFQQFSSHPAWRQQQLQPHEQCQLHYFPLIDKVKAYILALNLKDLLIAKAKVEAEK